MIAHRLELAIDLPPKGSRAVIASLTRQLKAAILDGRLAAGLRLPATRLLAQSLGISRNTVVAAYDLLLNEGYLKARPGAGTFIAGELMHRAPNKIASHTSDPRLAAYWRHAPGEAVDIPPFAYDFRMGLPEIRAFPFHLWRRLQARSLRALTRERPDYYPPQGKAPLREAIARHISAARAVACSADDIIVTTGSQQAFDLVARCLIEPRRTTVAVEEPGYPPVRSVFAAAGGDIRFIPVDDEGLRVDLLPKETRIIAVTPSHQFPLGVAMSMARRAQLIDFARKHRAVIVEDDYDSDFRFSSRPLDALKTLDGEGAVFYVGTFSKSLFPALRVGYLVCPLWARSALTTAKHLSDANTSTLAQDTLASFMSEGHLGRHLRKMRKIYQERRDTLTSAIERHCDGRLTVIPSAAGLHLSARLSPPHRAGLIAAKAAGQGIGLQPFERYAMAEASPNGLAFGYGLIEAGQIDEAVRRLAKLIV
jgi:GntR family transcriptional regulator / MocR family aminotransferase